MTQEDFEWLSENSLVLGNVRLTQAELNRIYKIYNAITGENKPTSSCGRCTYNVKQRLKIELKIHEERNNNH